MFNFADDVTDPNVKGERTPEQCPNCGKIGRVYASEKFDRCTVTTYYVCDTCNITWQDPPPKGSSAYGSGATNPLGDSGGDLSTLTGKR